MRALAALSAVAVALAAQATSAQQVAATAPAEAPSTRFRLLPPYADPNFRTWQGPPAPKNYVLAVTEAVGIDLGIWAFDYAMDKPYAKISFDSISDNFHKGWIVDTDDFWANQLMHPIHGNLTFNAGRSLGLNFYESFATSFVGSLVWEQFLEIQPPSMNDQVNTPFGGSMVGETMFRLSRMILDSGGYKPSAWREFFAFAINPVGGFNRLLFKDKYRNEVLLPKSWLGEFRFGAVVAGSNRNFVTGAKDVSVGPWASFAADIEYGIPGTPDLPLNKPFDHFTLRGSISLTSDVTAKPSATLMVRGLLLGDNLTLGDEPGGLWGLFTSYDFIAPAVFRVGGFGLGPGASLMKRWDWFELHGTVLGELLPWAGGGSTIPLGVRDYHYGPGGDLVLELRAHFGDRVIVRGQGREYWISGAYARGESEAISYGQAQVTVRVYQEHAVTGALDWGFRRASYPFQTDISQRAAVVNVYYTLLQGW